MYIERLPLYKAAADMILYNVGTVKSAARAIVEMLEY